MLHQISLAWRSNIKNNGRTIGLLSLENWRGINLWRNKNELSTLGGFLMPSHRMMTIPCNDFLLWHKDYIHLQTLIPCLIC